MDAPQKTYGRFIKVINLDHLIENLNTIWIGRFHLFANPVRFKRPKKPNLSPHNNAAAASSYPRGVDQAKGQFQTGSYVNVVNESFPVGVHGPSISSASVLVLDDSCVAERDLSNHVMGLWVMIECDNVETKANMLQHTRVKSWSCVLQNAVHDFVSDERIVWVDIEGIPLNVWSRKVYMVRVKELFTWNLIFLGQKEMEYTSDDDSDVGPQKVPDRSQFCEEGPNDDRSTDPFNIYRLLRKQPEDDSHEVSSSLSHPPGFTLDVSIIRNENGQSAKEISVVVNNKVMNNSQDVYKEASCDNVDPNVVKKGGSVLGVMKDMIRVGKAMGLGHKTKKEWIKELTSKNKINFMAIQETKTHCVNHMDVKFMWGNSNYNYVYSEAVGNSGGILCVWEATVFKKDYATISDNFVSQKRILWDYVSTLIDRWNGEVVVLGDFNEVWNIDERRGSCFNPTSARVFDQFISASGLVDVKMEGYTFTWSYPSGFKISKLDRFLVSEGEWSDDNLKGIINIHQCFFLASGLKINIQKSQVLGEGVPSSIVMQAASSIGCGVLHKQFRYLGVTVGECMSRHNAWASTVDKLRSRLSKWNVKTLSIGGRLTLLKVVLDASPLYNMSIFKKITWAAWNKVLASKENGGLGVSSYHALNRAILLKWVWRFISQDGPLWFRVIKALYGTSIDSHPEVTVADKVQGVVSSSFMRLVRAGSEYQHLTDLNLLMELVSLSHSCDRWICDLSGNGKFRVKEVCNFLDNLFLPSYADATRWVKYIPIKINVFVWHARRDFLPTRVNLSPRGILLETSSCPLCLSSEENIHHVLFGCDLAENIFRRICRWNRTIYNEMPPRRSVLFDDIMDRSKWMYEIGHSKEAYVKGVFSFLQIAEANWVKNGDLEIWCPCKDCKIFDKFSDIGEIENHLITRVFVLNYTRWSRCGELQVNSRKRVRVSNENDNKDSCNNNDSYDNNDLYDSNGSDIIRKIKANVSQHGRGVCADLHKCVICGESMYKSKQQQKNNNVNEKQKNKNDENKVETNDNDDAIKIGPPAKQLWYFPIIPRLKQLFANEKDAKLLPWHAEGCKRDGKLRHVAYSPQWRKIDSKFDKFGAEIRNIRNKDIGNSFVNVVKGSGMSLEMESTPTIVLDDVCLNMKNLSCSLMGRVNEFTSLSSLKKVLCNEGFDVLKISYLVPGWTLEFTKEEDEDDVLVEDNHGGIHSDQEISNCNDESDVEEVPETCFNVPQGQKGNLSKDPFGIYPLLNKDKNIREHKINEEESSLKHPSRFTLVGNLNEGHLDEGCAKKVNEEVAGDDNSFVHTVGGKENSGPVNKMSDSMGSCRLKKSGMPRTGGSILSFMEEVVKVGQTIGYNMDEIKLMIVVVYAPQEASEKRMLWAYLTHVSDQWDGEIVMMGDFNAVRYKSERFGSNFKAHDADIFNSFIHNAGLNEAIDKGNSPVEMFHKCLETFNKIQQVNNIHMSEVAQKAKIEWVVEGDENTKFFHDMLNKKRNQRSIQGIMVNGTWIDDQVKMKYEFLNHFCNKFDKPPENRARIDICFLNVLLNDQRDDLECMVMKEEVKKAVWDCGSDKSPGPDGFSFSLFPHFWSTIEKDIFKAVDCFFTNEDMPNGCNSNFITLIPKIIEANMVKYFRPISLIGSLYKVIAKILTNRLVNVIGDLVNEVQQAFVADRQILDGLFILNEVIQSCCKKKKHTLISKVDFEKAYDSRVVDGGLFTGIKLNSMVSVSHLFYADDAIFIGQWSELNIDTLVQVLECFYRAFGLRINICKSKIMGVNVEEGKIQKAASKLGCLVLKTPFTYPGTKVSDNMSRKEAWKEVVDKMLSRLSKLKTKTLSIGVPLYVLKTLESIRSRFFNGQDHKSRKSSWVRWDNVLTSRDKGCLGVKSSLWTRVIKAIHGDGGKLDKDVIVGGQTCWTLIVKEARSLKRTGINVVDLICLKLGNEDSSLFWDDKWYVGGVIKELFPRLYALELHKHATVRMKLMAPSLDNSFRRRTGIWSLESEGDYSVASILKLIDEKRFQEVGISTRWVKSLPSKVNITAWKIKTNALPTRFNLSLRGMDIDTLMFPVCKDVSSYEE
uniref:RNA-directed DNA polymerase, eukaryota n=1 Tax=Tanacetum cinerariifolium TaxID=118510 RepID=A0A6L2KLE8_TANCI|nr:RNA-directed DNA polymerase, eukaryota [Tanacetum cinerariifolium]